MSLVGGFQKKTGRLRGKTTYTGRIIIPTKEIINYIKINETIGKCWSEYHKKKYYLDFEKATKLLAVLDTVTIPEKG